MMCLRNVVFPVPAFPVKNTFLLVLFMNREAIDAIEFSVDVSVMK